MSSASFPEGNFFLPFGQRTKKYDLRVGLPNPILTPATSLLPMPTVHSSLLRKGIGAEYENSQVWHHGST